MNISILGVGYVGLVTGSCLSKYHNVICCDIDQTKIEALKNLDRIQSLEKEVEVAHKAIRKAEESTIALKTANAMLGSDDYKTKTKLKINALVREIDQCIAQLT